jgi:hypothetical protein
LGDSIQFIRYARLVKARGGTVVVLCPAPLARLFRGVAGIDRLVTDRHALPACDWQAPLLSLPPALGTTLATIPAPSPYLEPEPALVARWLVRLAALPGLKVGVVWRGSALHKNDHNRSMPAPWVARLFARLTEQGGCSLVSLQPDAGTVLARNVVDIGAELADFAETAAVIAGLDLVISVDTAVAHLTGALGRPGLVLLPAAPDWRWLLERADSPWYPTLRLFRQPVPGDWDSVIAQVSAAVAKS